MEKGQYLLQVDAVVVISVGGEEGVDAQQQLLLSGVLRLPLLLVQATELLEVKFIVRCSTTQQHSS